MRREGVACCKALVAHNELGVGGVGESQSPTALWYFLTLRKYKRKEKDKGKETFGGRREKKPQQVATCNSSGGEREKKSPAGHDLQSLGRGRPKISPAQHSAPSAG